MTMRELNGMGVPDLGAIRLSVVRHPGDALLDYLQRSFIELKRKQAQEIDATQGKEARR
jgi:hypothetical protein